MSEIKQVVVHVTDSPRSRDVVRFALALARAHDARLTAWHAVEPMPAGAYLTPEASSIAARLNTETQQARLDRARTTVAEIAAADGGTVSFESATGDPLAALQSAGRATDLLVVGQPDPDVGDGLTAGFMPRLLVGAGCPVLFVPFAGDHRPVAQRALVGWAETRESARALRDALPLLRRAEEVELVNFRRGEAPAKAASLERICDHLRHHGVRATGTVRQSREPSVGEQMLRSWWTPDASVAEALLSHAADTNADLIVMGGYGHSRAWEMALGGVTRTLLQSMTVPVMMSH